ncbi:hypothetical protein BDY24DRAFT_410611 [Mrakia frigida]|uniref:Atg7p n=1 Tax=Mrakia frigida TaxID=29902 RepID=UPI003FCBF3D3
MVLLQFSPLQSAPSPSFFHALTKHKLDVARLDDSLVSITGEYSEGKIVLDREGGKGEEVGIPGGIELGLSSFESEGEFLSSSSSAPNSTSVPGLLKNFNTIEEFREADKPALFQSVVDSIHSSLSTSSPSLSPFLLLTFADLKKFKFYYWFAFPGLVQKPAWEVEGEELEGGWKRVDSEELSTIKQLIPTFKSQHPATSTPGSYLLSSSLDSTSPPVLLPLTSFASLPPSSSSEPPTLVFHDPSTLPSNPGWPLRNILFYLSTIHHVHRIRVVCLREGDNASREAVVVLPRLSPEEALAQGDGGSGKLKGVGWEKNEKGKLGPRVVDLGPTMDPLRLANQAVDLNLKLMRWRILPSLDLEKISSTKCLLLGAGTLGCYVSRVLMGWGVRKITFVDSSTVSFSNPVRQPLFEFADSLDGGKPKAECAAAALTRVFPGVDAQGHHLSIPMPGHPLSSSTAIAQAQESVSKLEQLVEDHDVIFLLMDSRESRWLPTLLGASKGKVVINAALGFDGYLVMRHGEGPGEGVGKEEGERRRLACYFCQDSNALGNSLNDRTLDQMCTVSRPGLAAIASATAVELLVSLLTHPLGIAAPADLPPKPSSSPEALPDKEYASPLGMVPHQLRGGLSMFTTLNLAGEAFDMCTACGSKVVEEYRSKGFDMLLKAFNEEGYLAKLTGLEKLNRETEEIMEGLDWDEEDEE